MAGRSISSVSLRGGIALHFAADHADLVRRLVVHSSAHTLGDAAKEAQLGVAWFARQGRWREAWELLLDFFLPQQRGRRVLVWLASRMMALSAPQAPFDLVVTVEAEDKHSFQDRLVEITAPTLVIAGTEDPGYTEALFRETAEGIPDGRLILYEKMGHPAGGKRFARDVLAFLREEE